MFVKTYCSKNGGYNVDHVFFRNFWRTYRCTVDSGNRTDRIISRICNMLEQQLVKFIDTKY